MTGQSVGGQRPLGRASGRDLEQALHLALENDNAIILPLGQSDNLPPFLFERDEPTTVPVVSRTAQAAVSSRTLISAGSDRLFNSSSFMG